MLSSLCHSNVVLEPATLVSPGSLLEMFSAHPSSLDTLNSNLHFNKFPRMHFNTENHRCNLAFLKLQCPKGSCGGLLNVDPQSGLPHLLFSNSLCHSDALGLPPLFEKHGYKLLGIVFLICAALDFLKKALWQV